MDSKNAIIWLKAILDDTLDPNDESDRERRKAVELAIDALEKRIKTNASA